MASLGPRLRGPHAGIPAAASHTIRGCARARPRSTLSTLRMGASEAAGTNGAGGGQGQPAGRLPHRPGGERPFVPRGPRGSLWLAGEGVERGGRGRGRPRGTGSGTLWTSQVALRVGHPGLRTRRLPPLLYVTPSAFRFPLLGRGGTSGSIATGLPARAAVLRTGQHTGPLAPRSEKRGLDVGFTEPGPRSCFLGCSARRSAHERVALGTAGSRSTERQEVPPLPPRGKTVSRRSQS